MTSPPTAPSALASPPFHTYATGENGGARPSSNVNAHANVLLTATTFTTQAPQLTSEKAHSTALFLAFEELCSRVAAWSTRLAQDFASSDVTSPVLEATSRHGSLSKTSLPHNSSTQTAGEAATSRGSWPTAQPRLGGLGIQRTNPVSSFVPPQPHVHSTVETRELLASSNAASAPSSYSNPPDTTSTTSKFYEQAAARAPNTSENAHANPLIMKTPTLPTLPTPTSTPTLPPWLATDVEVFFNEHLARAIQIRESHLVNTIHECVQQELQRLQRRVQTLEHHASESDKTRAHLQSKLDRRVEESNALRKEYYKQLLMLRDLVGKRRHDPRTLKAVEDEIAAVVQGGDASATTIAKAGAAWLYPRVPTRDESDATDKVGSTATITATGGSVGMRKEKEKWEERAREAAAECQQLHEQVLVLKQQLEEARGLDGELWFATAQHGLYERQRMIDSVYKSKCTWSQVGDAILELVNNELVWEAVETSAFRDKGRVSRGLEALILRAESLGVHGPTGDGDAGLDGAEMANDSVSKRGLVRRRSSACFGEGSRVIMCRTCNGCGYLDASTWTANHQVGAPDEEEDGSYLRKTLAQVLELKTSLEEATTRANHAEQELLRTVMEGAQMKEMMEKIEHARVHRMDCCLQVDLDEDEEISVDDIMNAYSGPGGGGTTRGGGRWKQYEHLIVELKNLLSERDAGLAQLRKSVADSQSRLINLQKTSQRDQERLQRELQTLKGSLALTMSSRNNVIEEKQAAVNQLLQSLDRQQSQSAFSSKRVLLLPRSSQNRDTGAVNVDGNNDMHEDCGDEGEEEDVDGDDNEDEVTRTERMARRYSLAVGRVQREHDEQQQRLEQTERELGTEAEKRKRTNSIMLGGMAVSMASHPRDLFKALSSTHQELLNYRRSSQRASALQTDRLLTLTTHLAHISEELAMVKKRTSAEIEFWKLDCEKLQNTNQALAADLETAHQMIDEANERTAQANARNAVKVCGPCAKHEERLLAISAMLLKDTAGGDDGGGNGGRGASVVHRPSSAQAANATQLNDVERHGLGAILLDLENLYSTLSSSKQRQAKEAIARALLSDNGQINLPNSSSSLQDGSSRSDNERSTGLFTAPSVRADGSVSVEEPNTAKRSSQAASPSVRLFQDSFTASLQRDAQSSTSIVVQGSSISAPVFMGDNLQAHHRKTIVRKVLSEQEALIRQRAASRRGHHPSRDLRDATGGGSITEWTPGPVSVDTPEMDEPDDGGPVYSTYVDEDGKQVFFVDVEEEDCDESESESTEALSVSAVSTNVTDPLSILPSAQDPTPAQAAASRRLDLSFQIPSPDRPIGGLICDLTGEHQKADVIDKDPEVIQKLRELVNNNARARELLALMNWRILMSHFQANRDQRRLEFVNDTWRTASASRVSSASANTMPQAVRTTMQKLVQWREVALDDAVCQRDELRKQSRRAQTHLIHCVSTVLTNLTRKSKTSMLRSDSLPLVRIDPQTYRPRRSPGTMHLPSRPLYPSTRVNLSEIPATQHVPTPSFPLPVELPSLSESQSVGTPRDASLTPIRASGNQESINEVPWTPSIFENDNRFPQRSVKFVPVGGGDDLSLMHSTSPLPVSSPSSSPSKSPSRAEGLSVDAIRRPIHSAGPSLGGSFNPPLSDPSSDPAAPHFLDLFSRQPVRPQSSPAGPRTRFRPSSATASPIESGMAEGEVRPPEHSAVRPSSSRAER